MSDEEIKLESKWILWNHKLDDNSWSNSYKIHFQIKLVPNHGIYTWYLVQIYLNL